MVNYVIDRKSFLLLVVSTLVALLLCEGGLRVLARFRPKPPVVNTGPVSQDDLNRAARRVAQLPALADTDRRWFLEDPPPLANRTQPAPAQIDRFRDFERRGIYPAQAQYIWNRKYVESKKCLPDGVFKNYPDIVLAFDPPGGSVHPPYRFPIRSTLPSGLVTNQFGLRGPEIALAKPPKTIRIAFVGASTTITTHSFAFSPAERVVFWLNRYAQAHGYDAHFEVLNAGREGITSEDIASIVRDEVAALDPDLAVYYEGANQFAAVDLAAFHWGSAWTLRALELFYSHSAIIDLVRTSVAAGREPWKPWHYLKWPEGVDRQAPDVDSPRLPLKLPTIVHYLDSIRETLRPGGGRLLLCSFVWLASDGLVLSKPAYRYIYEQLNRDAWPLRYSEIRRLADFQNLVFRRYAASRAIPFLDVAGVVPQDPDLFADAVHMTETGERVKAWVMFQQLAPVVRQEIESGRLPRQGPRPKLPPPASYATAEMSPRCR
jgi:hypothetical protein